MRGKILRVNLDGSAPPDNPFYDAADGLPADGPRLRARVCGIRSAARGATLDGAHWEVENGPSRRPPREGRRRPQLRLGRLGREHAHVRGIQLGASPSPRSTSRSSSRETLRRQRIPRRAAWTTPSSRSRARPTAPGPQILGKRISEFVFDAAGASCAGPRARSSSTSARAGTAVGLAAGPGRPLLHRPLQGLRAASAPIERGASVFRIRWTGVADFTADAATGPAPLTVSFHDASTCRQPRRGTGSSATAPSSDEREPVHRTACPAAYDVPPDGHGIRRRRGPPEGRGCRGDGAGSAARLLRAETCHPFREWPRPL